MDQIGRINPSINVAIARPGNTVKEPEKNWSNDSLIHVTEDSWAGQTPVQTGESSEVTVQSNSKPEKIDLSQFIESSSMIITSENSTVLKELETSSQPPIPKTLTIDMENSLIYSGSQTDAQTALESIKMAEKPADINKDAVATIGTFNIEWLGNDKYKKRTEEDYKMVAQVIKDTGASLLGIEEVADLKGLANVMKHLPNFGYIISKQDMQMVGMIFDKDRVKYDPGSLEYLNEASFGDGYRPPFMADMKVDNFDFKFMVMHLKAKFDPKSMAAREKQTKEINKWLTRYLTTSKDKDVIMVGDYNDFVGSRALNNITSGGVAHVVTDEAKEKGLYSNIPHKGIIDHITVSDGYGGAEEEFIKGTTRTIDENDYPGYLESVSDHKPMFSDFRTGVDND